MSGRQASSCDCEQKKRNFKFFCFLQTLQITRNQSSWQKTLLWFSSRWTFWFLCQRCTFLEFYCYSRLWQRKVLFIDFLRSSKAVTKKYRSRNDSNLCLFFKLGQFHFKLCLFLWLTQKSVDNVLLFQRFQSRVITSMRPDWIITCRWFLQSLPLARLATIPSRDRFQGRHPWRLEWSRRRTAWESE